MPRDPTSDSWATLSTASGDSVSGRAKAESHLIWGPIPVALDQPLLVVATPELPQGLDQLPDRGKGSDPDQAFLQCTDEPFCDAIALGFPHEARGARHAEEGQFLLKVIAHISAAMVMANRQPR